MGWSCRLHVGLSPSFLGYCLCVLASLDDLELPFLSTRDAHFRVEPKTWDSLTRWVSFGGEARTQGNKGHAWYLLGVVPSGVVRI